MATNKITVAVTVSADINKVWNYWTLPEHIVNWNFASDDWHCPSSVNDLRINGKFSSVMASKDGRMSFAFEGIYTELIRHQKIAFIMEDGRAISIVFENPGNTTQVTQTFDPETINTIELQRNGWQAIMNNFKKYVETH